MITVSGYLKNGFGEPIKKCTIHFKSIKTSSEVIIDSSCKTKTGDDGYYFMEVEPCKYEVFLSAVSKNSVGKITVYSDSQNGTLNDFLLSPSACDLTPETLRLMQKWRDEAEQFAKNAELASELAYSSANNASQSEYNAINAASSAAQNAANAEKSASSANNSAQKAESEVNRIIDSHPVLSINNTKADENGNINISTGGGGDFMPIAPNDNLMKVAVGGDWQDIPEATATQKGITKLSSDITSNSEVEAATLKAVKEAYDLASSANELAGGLAKIKPVLTVNNQEPDATGNVVIELLTSESMHAAPDDGKLKVAKGKEWIDVPSASTSQSGIVQLSSDITSSSESIAATSKAVTTIYNVINGKFGGRIGWRYFTNQRFRGTRYTNTTSQPIVVSVYFNGKYDRVDVNISIDGIIVAEATPSNIESSIMTISTIVPVGASYSANWYGTSTTLEGWAELREM